MLPADLVQPDRHVGGVQKHRRADERDLILPALLPRVELDHAGQPFGLPVGQDIGIVLRSQPAIRHPTHPLGAVAANLALPVLQLEDIEATAGEHQGVELVDRAIRADKLHICPHVKRVGVGEIGGEVAKAVLLVRKDARVDLLPSGRVLTHAKPPPRCLRP